MTNFPRNLNSIDRAWLERALQSSYSGGRLHGVIIGKAHSGTTGRARLVLDWEKDGPPNLPETIFVKLPPTDDAQKERVVDWGMGRREAIFYKHLAQEIPLTTPQCFFSDYSDDGHNYIMLLDDLRASGARPARVLHDSTLDTAQQLMDSLARMHAVYWESPRFGRDLQMVERFPLVRNSETGRLIRQARDNFAHEMPEIFSRACSLLLERQDDIAALFEQGPATFIHGDCHIGNLFFDREGQIGFLDWALCAKMPGMWDVSYVLSNSFPHKFRREHEDALLHRYRDSLADHGIVRGIEEIRAEHRLFVFYSWISTALTAGAGDQMQSLETGLRGTRWTTQALIDLRSLDHIEDLLGR